MTNRLLIAPLALTLLGAGTPAQAQGWMHPDVAAAHSKGYEGQGVGVIVVDHFNSKALWTKLDYWGFATHGELMRRLVRDVAPRASVTSIEVEEIRYSSLAFRGAGLKVVNLSLTVPRKSASDLNVGAGMGSVMYAARTEAILTVKAAGNSGVSMNAKSNKGKIDALNYLLKDSNSVIYVGALERNGSTAHKTTRAAYSNHAGGDPVYQSRMLYVGVDKDQIIRAQGTSAAAAIVSGYAAVVGSKFKNASPIQVSNQLLKTARQDTIQNYNSAIYGRGEASLSRALAPASLK